MFSPETTSAGNSRRGKSRESGMTLVELMVAMAVLAVGMLGSMLLLLTGMQTNSRNRNDTSAAVLDQEIIEKFATLKQYPKSGYVTIYDCALAGTGHTHQASLIQGAASAGGAGATLYTSSTAPTADKVGDIDWTVAAPALATVSAQGYAMHYHSCNGDIYEVRWNIMQIGPNSRVSLLTVSSRQVAAQAAQNAGAPNQAVLYAQPTTLKTLIED